MILTNIVSPLLIAVCVIAQYRLVFDKKTSPPHSIPANPLNMYYSVPLNQTISKPIIAYVLHRNGSVVTDGAMSKAVFTIQSINEQTAHRNIFQDNWADRGGKLCQRAVWWEDFPKRMDRSRAKERCGVYPNATMLTVQAFKGRIFVDGILHSHVDAPKADRILRIMFQQLQISVDSYPLRISEPAARIVITSQPPLSITSNQDFNITAEIKDRNNTLVTTGLDSIAFVELTVPYYYKTFYSTESKEMLVKTTAIRLSGEDVVSHQSTNDLISRRRASGGIVQFNNIRILDAVSGLRLNLTMSMARDPWFRIPICSSCYDDTKDYNINADGTEISFRPLLSYKHIKSMAFTDTFRVTEQKLKSLTFSKFTSQNWNKWNRNGTIPVTRNVLLPGHLFLQARDAGGSIIYSGRDSSFQLAYQTDPKGVCISSDATRHFSGGQMYITLSVCEIIRKVEIIVSTHNDSIYVKTPFFEVGGNINIGHFGDFQHSGSGAEIDVHINSFIKFAVQDVNQGLQAKSLSGHFGFKLKVHSYDTKGDAYKAFNLLANIVSPDVPPEDVIHILISSSKDIINRALNPELNKIHLPYISVANSADVTTKQFPFSNRVCWSESSILRSILLAVKQRLWTKLILIRTDTIVIGDTFRGLAAKMGISIGNEVMINDFSEEIKYATGDLLLDKEMRLIKSFGSKIICLFADGKTQQYILRAAYLAGIDSDHGYQWVLISESAWQFPFLNQGVCGRGPKPCNVAFKGTIIFSETYNVSGYMTEEWIRTVGRSFSSDRFNLLGGRSRYHSPEIAGKIALGYDAVILFANALIQILKNDETITGKAVAENLRKVEVEGLTGKITLNEHGDRTGYLGFIGQVWPKSDKVNIAMKDVFETIRLLTYQKNVQYEIPYMVDHSRLSTYDGYHTVPSLKYNTRKYVSFTGWIHRERQLHTPRPGEDWPPRIIVREEKLIPPFYCSVPCGKKLLSDANINIYDTGKCTAERNCSCYRGYRGKECKSITCNCKNGICISLENCRCSPGWNGTSCDMAQCSKCVHGECVEPETCQCNSTLWIGYACHIHLAIVLVPTLLSSCLLIIFMIYCTTKLIRRIQRNAGLSRVDWIIEWSMVTQPLASDISINQSSALSSRPFIETYTWRNETWYVKFFNNRTMDPKDGELCLEMLELTTLRHRNLIIYGGACLTAPNVSLFVELASKGSLNDILHNDGIELSWDFRYSFMRDICSGMRYLHENTELGSHGRLKSLNCLVDSRWTIRISGFGASTIRYGKYRNESAQEESMKGLLWTAPELLRHSRCIDDVKNGTQAGDVYSFAMVLCEILTRAEPYYYEMEFIDVSNQLELILGNNYPGLKEARRIWEDIGGADMLTARPILKMELMPKPASVGIRFKKMLDDAWHDNPFSRPTFETLINQLNIICPAKGELIENIINLLEAYSNNLEIIVLERTVELEANKARTEELLSEMLPANVTVELKHGRNVLPEIFECATVFFSDIADFTSICQTASPFQLVTLLNETYSVFDKVLEEYDVYKIKTACEYYMVVSGVPVKNGNRHAGEICTMALDLMSTVATFIIPQMPKITLQLRIGVHSGLVVAGVVGVLLPRYCLIGDTVNTASEMMTSSYAFRIQISDTTADILDELGGYNMECRGEQQVAGCGLMTTYWLWGRDGFRKTLPDQNLAISVSQHVQMKETAYTDNMSQFSK